MYETTITYKRPRSTGHCGGNKLPPIFLLKTKDGMSCADPRHGLCSVFLSRSGFNSTSQGFANSTTGFSKSADISRASEHLA